MADKIHGSVGGHVWTAPASYTEMCAEVERCLLAARARGDDRIVELAEKFLRDPQRKDP